MIEFKQCDGRAFAAYADASVDVYMRAMARPPHMAPQRRALVVSHLDRRDLRAVLALDGEQLVGFGYAYAGAPGQWWYDSVAQVLGPERAADWLADPLELVELHVLPDHQGQGLGREILTRLLTDVSQRTVLLSTHDHDSRARRLYRNLGFTDLVTGYRFPGGREVFAIMGKRLR